MGGGGEEFGVGDYGGLRGGGLLLRWKGRWLGGLDLLC